MNANDLIRLAGTQAWQLTALIAAVAVTARLVAGNRPHLAHTLWLLVLLKCFCLPLWSSPAGVFCWLQRVDLTKPDVPDSAARRSNDVVASVKAAPVDGAARRLVETSGRAPGSGAALPLSPDPRARAEALPASTGLSLAQWLALLWLGGTAISLAWLSSRWLLFLARLRRSSACEFPQIAARVEQLARTLGVRRRVRLRVTDSRIGPAVVGLWRPTVLLPAVIVRGKTPAELEPILAHELIHIRRGDLWLSLAQALACSLWWFHLPLWWALRWAQREAERCCDEEVLAELRCEPAVYARSLLDVLDRKRWLWPVPAVPGVRPVEITSRRLERIMKLGQGGHRRTPWWCRAVLLLLAGLALPGGAMVAAGDKPKRQRKPPQPAVEPCQLMIEAKLISGAPEAMQTLTENWNVLAAQVPAGQEPADRSRTPRQPASQRPAPNQASVVQTLEKRLPVTFAVLSEASAQALDREVRSGNSPLRVEAAPRIVTFNARRASLESTVRRPFVVGLKEDASGQPQPQLRVVPCGWSMNILPVVHANDRVRLDLQIHVSDLRGVEDKTLTRGQGQEPLVVQVPELASSQLDMGYELPLGHTLLIGGLTRPGDGGQPQSMLIVLRCSRVTSLPEPPASAASPVEPPAKEPAVSTSAAAWPPKDSRPAPPAGPVKSGLVALGQQLQEANYMTHVPTGESIAVVNDGCTITGGPWRVSFGEQGQDAERRLLGESGKQTIPDTGKREGRLLELTGGVQLTFDDLLATAESARLQGTKLELTGKVRLKDARVELSADRVELTPGLVTADHAEFRRTLSDGRTRTTAVRLQWSPEKNHLRLIEADTGNHSPRDKALKAYEAVRLYDPTGPLVEDLVLAAANERLVQDRSHVYAVTYNVADLWFPVRTASIDVGNQLVNEKRLGPPQPDFQPLVDLIRSTIRPGSWSKEGGCVIAPFATNLSLVVAQTRGAHEEIAELFEQLRRQHDVQVGLELRLLRLDAEQYLRSFRRLRSLDLDLRLLDRKPAESRKLAVAELSSNQATALLEAVQNDRSSPLQVVKPTVFNGQSVELKLPPPKEAGQSSRLKLVASVTDDRRRVLIRLSDPENAAYQVSEGQSLLVNLSGGLHENVESDSTSPLRRIPTIERLFQQGSATPAKEAVYLLLTPHIIIQEEEEQLLKPGE